MGERRVHDQDQSPAPSPAPSPAEERIQVQVTLRERNQLTLPDRIAARIGAKPGDRLLLTVGPAGPGEPGEPGELGEPGEAGVVRLKRLPDSYAGIADGIYGRTAEEHAAYIAAERDSWEREPVVPMATAPDGTPYLTFEESRRTYWQTDVTRERYEREAKLRWPKCDVCGRSIARMRDHQAAHRAGKLDQRGSSTDPTQRARSRRRVEKRRVSLARKART